MQKLTRGLVAGATVAAALVAVPGTAEAVAPRVASQQRGMADFDGDAKADLTVWRPSNGTWYISQSSGVLRKPKQYGQAGDVPVPADYNGDGKTDPGEWRPSNSSWHYTRSTDGQTVTQQYGEPNPWISPAIGDFDGDGRDDGVTVLDESGTWRIRYANGTTANLTIGQTGDVPV